MNNTKQCCRIPCACQSTGARIEENRLTWIPSRPCHRVQIGHWYFVFFYYPGPRSNLVDDSKLRSAIVLLLRRWTPNASTVGMRRVVFFSCYFKAWTLPRDASGSAWFLCHMCVVCGGGNLKEKVLVAQMWLLHKLCSGRITSCISSQGGV